MIKFNKRKVNRLKKRVFNLLILSVVFGGYWLWNEVINKPAQVEPSTEQMTPYPEDGTVEPSAEEVTTSEAIVVEEQFDAGGLLDVFSLPEFDGQTTYVPINDNVPTFSEEEKQSVDTFEYYSELDYLGRVGVSFALLGKETMPSKGEKRGAISHVKPTGWMTHRSSLVDGGYLYNRAHMIGWQLSAENDNPKNLATGTRFFNVNGMLPFENLVADYIHRTGGHVLYRVTPVFVDEELVMRGLQMEAYSIEDSGASVSFNVYVYNAQPGFFIDYLTGVAVTE